MYPLIADISPFTWNRVDGLFVPIPIFQNPSSEIFESHKLFGESELTVFGIFHGLRFGERFGMLTKFVIGFPLMLDVVILFEVIFPVVTKFHITLTFPVYSTSPPPLSIQKRYPH